MEACTLYTSCIQLETVGALRTFHLSAYRTRTLSWSGPGMSISQDRQKGCSWVALLSTGLRAPQAGKARHKEALLGGATQSSLRTPKASQKVGLALPHRSLPLGTFQPLSLSTGSAVASKIGAQVGGL